MLSNHAVFEQLFKEEIASNPGGNFLKDIVEAHPYFAPAHFFLLKGTAKDTAAYAKEAATTALLFNNPLWLNWQLQYGDREVALVNKKDIEVPAEEAGGTTAAPLPVAENVQVSDAASVPHTTGNGGTGTTMRTEAGEAGATKEAKPNKDELLFEPMHLVDYFASQGIKLTEEMQNADKLGKQLKSFTQWLKTMKKVHEGQLPEATEQAERVIKTLAEKSNAGEEVLTESMAEVFAIQGKHQKAIEVYEKLSLLNPSKSAYFAAKIAGTRAGNNGASAE